MAKVYVRGTPDIERIRQATIIFLKQLQKEKRYDNSDKTRGKQEKQIPHR